MAKITLFGVSIVLGIIGFIIIAFVVAATVTNNIIDNVTDKFSEGCTTPKSDGGLGLVVQSEIEFCQERVEASTQLDNFVKEDCAGRLGLTGEDITFCEQNFDDNAFLIGLGNFLGSFADRFSIDTILDQDRNTIG